MNKAQKRPILHKVLSMILALVMVLSLLPVSALAETTGASNSTDEFMRIFHLDCGRKYFTVAQIEDLIDCAAENNYTHVELAFGNDGLRFLLDDMSVGDYVSENVKAAIQNGNKAFYDAGDKNELTETEMSGIIAHANSKNIEIIPMFDAPGHLQAVIKAMQTLGFSMSEGSQYSVPTTSGTSANWAINPTYTKGLNFVQDLMQKYIDYFAGKGCKYFNIAADECGFATYDDKGNFTSGMSKGTYTAYANFVNAMAKCVKDAGMTPMAFNDGIYHKNLTLDDDVSFDTGIMICYWDASTNKYASASELAQKGFKIINTHNKWYYVVGTNDNDWYGAQWSKGYMTGNGDGSKCDVTDGDYKTNTGCMNAVWCDTPSKQVNLETIKDHISTLAKTEYNQQFFVKVVAPTVTINSSDGKSTLDIDGTATLSLSNGATATWTVEPDDVVSLSVDGTKSVTGTSVTVTALKAGTATITATTTDGKTYTYPLTVQSADELEQKTITVQAGNTATDTIKGYNYAGTYETEDSTIATIDSVTGQDAEEGKVTYSKVSVKYSDLLNTNNNSTWTDTGYYYKTGSNPDTYERLYAKRSSSGRYYYYYYFAYGSDANKVTNINYGNYYSTRNTNNNFIGFDVYNEAGSEPVEAFTTVVFKGIKAGETTYATIGNVRYTIKVIAEDLTGKYLPIQTWFTNCDIEIGNQQTTSNFSSGTWQDNKKPYYVNIDAKDAYGEKGAALSAVLPNDLTRYEESNTYWADEKENKDPKNLVVWSARIHSNSEGNVQLISGDDYSNSGTEFSYVRYWGGSWSVTNTPDDPNSWTEITDTSATTASPSSSGVQLAVYYMMRTEITKEVTTDVADWGYRDGEKDYEDQIKKDNKDGDYVTLDFSVKYQDGITRNPDKFPIADKTFLFHCNSGSGGVKTTSSGDTYRQLNNFRGMNSGNYEIYMVTVTMTSDSPKDGISLKTSGNEPGDYTYDYETEQVVWAIDEATKNDCGFDEYVSISGADSVYSGCTIGGDPYIRGVEVYNHHGALITYYVRYKATLDSLTVHYVDLSTNKEFYYYNIGVSDEYGEDNMKFKQNIALDNPWKQELINGEVKNDLGVVQKVTADLSKMPDINPQYRYAIDYTCVEVDRKDDKNLYLYYTFKTDKTFVVDFGLPLVINPTDVSANLSSATITKVEAKADMGYAKVTVSDNNVTYTLTSVMNSADKLHLSYTGNIKNDEGQLQQGTVNYTVTIIPASTVYYEDSFASFTDGDGAAKGATWSIVDDSDETITENEVESANQALEALGAEGTNVYGYDQAYADSTKYSMGSAHKVTVTADMAKNWSSDSNSAWPTATFTFKGTGFDIISLTDNTSGTIFVDVVNSNGETVKSLFVDNYYGYTYNKETGKWEVKKEASDALYQIPVMKVTGLDYDTYTVKISLEYDSFFDHTKGNKYTFVLDAIRVYDPMGENGNNYYKDDGEGYPQYIKLRDTIAGAKDSSDLGYTLFIDGADKADIATYANYGPNNEVYLAKGQAISFKIPANEKIASIQIGAKAPDGKTANLVVKDETVAEELKTATEMYYDITSAADKGNTVTISNTGDGILSLTNLKITYSSKPADSDKVSLEKLSSEEQTQAVQAVRALFAAPVVEPFAPERFEAEWNSVRAGRQATLTVKTSTDVESITVNGVTVDSYKTRYERSGWGWWAQKVECREFSYTVKATETTDYDVCAVNADGLASDPITATLTVKPTQNSWWNNWWNGIFDKWF